MTGAGGGVILAQTDLATYQNCVISNSQACLYHDETNKVLYVNIYSDTMDGDNTILLRPVQIGYDGASADSKNTKSYQDADGLSFTFTVIPGNENGYVPSLTTCQNFASTWPNTCTNGAVLSN